MSDHEDFERDLQRVLGDNLITVGRYLTDQVFHAEAYTAAQMLGQMRDAGKSEADLDDVAIPALLRTAAVIVANPSPPPPWVAAIVKPLIGGASCFGSGGTHIPPCSEGAHR